MKKNVLVIISVFIAAILIPCVCSAQPYGAGTYNSHVPYGSETALSISTNGNVNISITPDSDGALTTGLSAVTVTSTDVVGYKLYLRALNSTDLDKSGETIPASSNSSPAMLATNTWGYNTDASENFTGITLNNTLIRSVSGPASSGSITNVTYGVMVDLTKPIGSYNATVVYTAVPQTD